MATLDLMSSSRRSHIIEFWQWRHLICGLLFVLISHWLLTAPVGSTDYWCCFVVNRLSYLRFDSWISAIIIPMRPGMSTRAYIFRFKALLNNWYRTIGWLVVPLKIVIKLDLLDLFYCLNISECRRLSISEWRASDYPFSKLSSILPFTNLNANASELLM